MTALHPSTDQQNRFRYEPEECEASRTVAFPGVRTLDGSSTDRMSSRDKVKLCDSVMVTSGWRRSGEFEVDEPFAVDRRRPSWASDSGRHHHAGGRKQ
jgi:hypothetical protein